MWKSAKSCLCIGEPRILLKAWILCSGPCKSVIRRLKSLHWKVEGSMLEVWILCPKWRWKQGAPPKNQKQGFFLLFLFIPFIQQVYCSVLLTSRVGLLSSVNLFSPQPDLCWANLVGPFLLKLSQSVNYHNGLMWVMRRGCLRLGEWEWLSMWPQQWTLWWD